MVTPKIRIVHFAIIEDSVCNDKESVGKSLSEDYWNEKEQVKSVLLSFSLLVRHTQTLPRNRKASGN